MMNPIPFDNSYARLPDRFYARLDPTPVRTPKLIRVNRELAEMLGIDPDWLASTDGVDILAGNRVPTGAEPIATAYAGHQFANFVPQLGDGRAILLGEVVAGDGRRFDIQLKGAGQTPFSRMGDGRAALGPVLREYVVSEAMAALGVPTTRSLAAVLTGEGVIRETILPGAVLTRVASSHIRVGTFQFFAARGDVDALRNLANHVMARHYPEVADAERPYRALLEAIAVRQAELVARWMLVGFIHGVMNTDNASIAGETIDYGPCAFMDAYHPATVFSSIDVQGRYAYGNQPRIAGWNMARLAEAMLPLLGDEDDQAIDEAQQALAAFGPRFDEVYQAGLRDKIGLSTAKPADVELITGLLDAMAENQVDFTLFFRRLCDAVPDGRHDEPVRSLFVDPTAFDAWAARWRERMAEEPLAPDARRAAMRRVNPAFIPRNHRVEAVIRAAVDHDDFAPFEALVELLARPCDDQPGFEQYLEPPAPDERVLRTFCGT